ncbi:DUF1828 domain-containing protein [Variovorax soli]|uniref:DUF1828 domain-containing protein n=1 Tax=Variovorax soli TaxID=376815 RepID=UPI000837CEAD|nr:DUF1828 domain-containing protein [Variovorax soli]
MICAHLTTLLGFDCTPLDEGGMVAHVSTPFRFADGDAVPVYVEMANGQVRFFDDGHTVMHFTGRGMRLEDGRHTRFLTTAAQAHGATFSDQGDMEAWAPEAQAADAFGRYMAAMLEVCRWEKDQEGASTDVTFLVDEVATALRAWKPTATITENPEFTGISGKPHRLDFLFDGQGVAVATPNPRSASAVLRRLVDIRSAHDNAALPLLVVVDDRADPEGAKREAAILQNVAKVLPFGSLERLALHSAPSVQ